MELNPIIIISRIKHLTCLAARSCLMYSWYRFDINVSSKCTHKIGAALRVRKTERSSPYNWTKITTLYT